MIFIVIGRGRNLFSSSINNSNSYLKHFFHTQHRQITVLNSTRIFWFSCGSLQVVFVDVMCESRPMLSWAPQSSKTINMKLEKKLLPWHKITPMPLSIHITFILVILLILQILYETMNTDQSLSIELPIFFLLHCFPVTNHKQRINYYKIKHVYIECVFQCISLSLNLTCHLSNQ